MKLKSLLISLVLILLFASSALAIDSYSCYDEFNAWPVSNNVFYLEAGQPLELPYLQDMTDAYSYIEGLTLEITSTGTFTAPATGYYLMHPTNIMRVDSYNNIHFNYTCSPTLDPAYSSLMPMRFGATSISLTGTGDPATQDGKSTSQTFSLNAYMYWLRGYNGSQTLPDVYPWANPEISTPPTPPTCDPLPAYDVPQDSLWGPDVFTRQFVLGELETGSVYEYKSLSPGHFAFLTMRPQGGDTCWSTTQCFTDSQDNSWYILSSRTANGGTTSFYYRDSLNNVGCNATDTPAYSAELLSRANELYSMRSLGTGSCDTATGICYNSSGTPYVGPQCDAPIKYSVSQDKVNGLDTFKIQFVAGDMDTGSIKEFESLSSGQFAFLNTQNEGGFSCESTTQCFTDTGGNSWYLLDTATGDGASTYIYYRDPSSGMGCDATVAPTYSAELQTSNLYTMSDVGTGTCDTATGICYEPAGTPYPGPGCTAQPSYTVPQDSVFGPDVFTKQFVVGDLDSGTIKEFESLSSGQFAFLNTQNEGGDICYPTTQCFTDPSNKSWYMVGTASGDGGSSYIYYNDPASSVGCNATVAPTYSAELQTSNLYLLSDVGTGTCDTATGICRDDTGVPYCEPSPQYAVPQDNVFGFNTFKIQFVVGDLDTGSIKEFESLSSGQFAFLNTQNEGGFSCEPTTQCFTDTGGNSWYLLDTATGDGASTYIYYRDPSSGMGCDATVAPTYSAELQTSNLYLMSDVGTGTCDSATGICYNSSGVPYVGPQCDAPIKYSVPQDKVNGLDTFKIQFVAGDMDTGSIKEFESLSSGQFAFLSTQNEGGYSCESTTQCFTDTGGNSWYLLDTATGDGASTYIYYRDPSSGMGCDATVAPTYSAELQTSNLYLLSDVGTGTCDTATGICRNDTGVPYCEPSPQYAMPQDSVFGAEAFARQFVVGDSDSGYVVEFESFGSGEFAFLNTQNEGGFSCEPTTQCFTDNEGSSWYLLDTAAWYADRTYMYYKVPGNIGCDAAVAPAYSAELQAREGELYSWSNIGQGSCDAATGICYSTSGTVYDGPGCTTNTYAIPQIWGPDAFEKQMVVGDANNTLEITFKSLGVGNIAFLYTKPVGGNICYSTSWCFTDTQGNNWFPLATGKYTVNPMYIYYNDPANNMECESSTARANYIELQSHTREIYTQNISCDPSSGICPPDLGSLPDLGAECTPYIYNLPEERIEGPGPFSRLWIAGGHSSGVIYSSNPGRPGLYAFLSEPLLGGNSCKATNLCFTDSNNRAWFHVIGGPSAHYYYYDPAKEISCESSFANHLYRNSLNSNHAQIIPDTGVMSGTCDQLQFGCDLPDPELVATIIEPAPEEMHYDFGVTYPETDWEEPPSPDVGSGPLYEYPYISALEPAMSVAGAEEDTDVISPQVLAAVAVEDLGGFSPFMSLGAFAALSSATGDGTGACEGFEDPDGAYVKGFRYEVQEGDLLYGDYAAKAYGHYMWVKAAVIEEVIENGQRIKKVLCGKYPNENSWGELGSMSTFWGRFHYKQVEVIETDQADGTKLVYSILSVDLKEDYDGDGKLPKRSKLDEDGDCNDLDKDVYPGAPEVCDGKVNKCEDIVQMKFNEQAVLQLVENFETIGSASTLKTSSGGIRYWFRVGPDDPDNTFEWEFIPPHGDIINGEGAGVHEVHWDGTDELGVMRVEAGNHYTAAVRVRCSTDGYTGYSQQRSGIVRHTWPKTYWPTGVPNYTEGYCTTLGLKEEEPAKEIVDVYAEVCWDTDKDGYYGENSPYEPNGDCDNYNAKVNPDPDNNEKCDGWDTNCSNDSNTEDIYLNAKIEIPSFFFDKTSAVQVPSSNQLPFKLELITDDPQSTYSTLKISNKQVAQFNATKTTWESFDHDWSIPLDVDGKVGKNTLGQYNATLELGCQIPGDVEPVTKTISLDFTLDMNQQCQLMVKLGSSASVASGNLFHSERLFDVSGTTGPMPGMTLYYNSRLGYDGPVGRSWTHSYNAMLVDGAGDTYVLQEADGGLKVLTNQGDYYAPLNSAYPALTILADGTRQLYYKSGVYYYFNEDGKIFAMSDLNGNNVFFSYDNTDNLVSVIDEGTGKEVAFTYRWDGKVTKITDTAGNEYELVYFQNNLEETNYPAGPGYAYSYTGAAYMISKTDPGESTTTYAFQPDWKVSTATDSEGGTRSITYNPEAGSAVVTEKDGGEWTYVYDPARGLLTSKTDSLGGTTSYEYDDYARRTAVIASDGARTEYTYDGWGNVSTVTDSEGRTTSYTYNALSQVTSVTSPEGLATTYTYDATGNMSSVTDATGNTTSYAYDDYGRVASIIAPTGATTSYTYDALGNLASVTDATGATTSFTYDASGRLASVTAPDGGTTTYAYDASGNVASVTAPNGSITSYTYDANGNVTSMTDAEGRTTTYTYDGEGRLIQVIDPTGATTTYTYGSSGCGSCGGGGGDRLTSITDASGNTTYYYYDPLGRLIQEVDALGRTILYEYDATGRMVSRTDASGNKVLFSYDSAGRMVKKTYPDGTYLAYTYDASGRMTGTANQNEAYAFEYDVLGRLIKVTDSAGRKLNYTYDQFGRKSSTDAAGVVSTNYSYDPSGRLAAISSPESGTFEFSYDASGRRSSLTYPNGVVATYGYDASGRLVDYLASGPRGDVAKSAYTLDGTGNRTSQETLFDTTHYSYDAAMRIIESMATLPGAGVEGKDNRSPSKGKGQANAVSNQAERYSYDIVGNRLTGPDARDSYEYAEGNMLIKDSVASYEYDTNGNLTLMQGVDWWVAYQYDYENRLTRVTDSNGMDVAYKYDPMGRRIEKNVLGQVTRYFYDSEDIAFEYSGNGTVGNIYVHGPGVDEPLGLTQTRGKYYYHADGLGSIIGITDASASLVQSYEYDSFGNLKDRKNRIKQPYTYTGREYDRETGLYYYRARYYMPEIGRFIQEDPIKFRSGDVNWYAYVGNDPIRYIDSSGLIINHLLKRFAQMVGSSAEEAKVIAKIQEGFIAAGLTGVDLDLTDQMCISDETKSTIDKLISSYQIYGGVQATSVGIGMGAASGSVTVPALVTGVGGYMIGDGINNLVKDITGSSISEYMMIGFDVIERMRQDTTY